MKRYILTGAPGAGKTAILRQLERDGHAVVEEAATDVIALEHARANGEPHTNAAFVDQIAILQRSRQLQAVAATSGLQFYDRSPVCTAALAEFLGYPVSRVLRSELDRIADAAVYRRTVFFIENLGFVTPTAARRINFADTLRFEAVHRRVYAELGYACVSIAPGPVDLRAEAIKAVVATEG
jgi:predicted ATPase